jgi:hypothetical protein
LSSAPSTSEVNYGDHKVKAPAALTIASEKMAEPLRDCAITGHDLDRFMRIQRDKPPISESLSDP